jgi:hypothetical protein
MIIKAYPGYIALAVGSRHVTVYGERCNQGYGNPTFVASILSLKKWDDGNDITEDDVKLIRETILNDFNEKGWTIEWE